MTRRIVILTTIIVLLAGAGWLASRTTSPPPQPAVALPSSAELAARIAAQINGRAPDPTARLDEPVDSAAIAARLATLTRTVTTAALPSDAELADYLTSHAQRYRQSDYFTFSYQFFSALDYGSMTRANAERQLEALRGGAAASPEQTQSIQQASGNTVDQQLGRGFAGQLAALWALRDEHCWQGPLSGRGGVYLVCLQEYRPGAMPTLDSVRDQLINDWRFEQLSSPAAR